VKKKYKIMNSSFNRNSLPRKRRLKNQIKSMNKSCMMIINSNKK
jgi:hypothetical protein